MADDRHWPADLRKSLHPKAPPPEDRGPGSSVQPKTDPTRSEERPAMPPADDD